MGRIQERNLQGEKISIFSANHVASEEKWAKLMVHVALPYLRTKKVDLMCQKKKKTHGCKLQSTATR